MGTTLIRKDLVLTEKVPSLSKLAHVASLTLIDDISKNLVKSPKFKQKFLGLPRHLLDEIFNAAFYNTHSNVVSTKIVSFDKIVNKMRLYPAGLLSSLRGLQGEKLFNFWWLFFDEEYSNKIGLEINCPTFSAKLMSYLKSINSVLENLVITYNWILRQEFKYLLDHLKHLKHLTVFSTFGAESQILEDITNSKCRLQSFKFGPDQKKKRGRGGMTQKKIFNFLEGQSDYLVELDMTGWLSAFDQKAEILEKLQICKKLKKLKIHFFDACCFKGGEDEEIKENFFSEILFKTGVMDLTIDFSDFDGWPHFFGFKELSWLKDVPVDMKIRFKGLKFDFRSNQGNDISTINLCKQVIEIDNLTFLPSFINPDHSWMIKSNWENLAKLSMKVGSQSIMNPPINLNAQDLKWSISFPMLKEATLDIGSQLFLYSSFKAILLNSKNLENLNINFSNNNGIRRFDEFDFENQLKTERGFKLKMLSLTCTGATRYQPMPFKSFVELVKKCPYLMQINFDLKPEQLQNLSDVGFTTAV